MEAPAAVVVPVAPEQLRRDCDPASLGFETTATLAEPDSIIGQPRAEASLALGLAMTAPGYNLYLAGMAGLGKTTLALDRLQRVAAARPVPPDWCYVFNFADPYRPRAISLAAGAGGRFAAAVAELVKDCRTEIPRSFESEQYEQRRQGILRVAEDARRALLTALEEQARSQGYAIEASPMGIVTVPLVFGRPISRQDFESLPEAQRADIQAKGEALREDVNRFLLQNRRLEKETVEKVQQLDREVAQFVIGPLVAEVRTTFDGHERLSEYFDALEADLEENVALFRGGEAAQAQAAGLPFRDEDLFARYEVNVVVDNGALSGAPVIVEHNPTYYNLTGRIDYAARLGAMVTDHRFVKAGALHRASGGYLVIQARDVLVAPFAWDALKRVLRTGQVAPENLGEQYSPLPTATLKPEAIPVTPKVIVVGDGYLGRLLMQLDEDYQNLFKVRADFDSVMPRTPESEHLYARFLARHARESSLLAFDRTAVARAVEYGSRLVGDQRRLSTCFRALLDMGAEASYWAGARGGDLVTGDDVERAIRERVGRANLVEERLRELVTDGTLLVATEGSVVGQINGLSVLDMGDYAFGQPSRITARVGPGSAGVVNIEREIRQSGPAHSRGIMALSGYLLGQYALEAPLALSASLGFEQVYEQVDGDSASAAELFALLSALSEVPLRQDLAVTGSVNQRGEIQAIGGANEKIEGFFEVCRRRGFTGTQGVILPRSNLPHLMLRREVVEAHRRGEFTVYAIASVDEGLALLTGVAAGGRDTAGHFPAASVHALAAARLAKFAARVRAARLTTAGRRAGSRPDDGDGGAAAEH